jgi:iron complex transport system substrate-binding protein
VRAVRENAVYRCPVGAFWWDRPSPEAILGIMWLAKTLYPSACADVDIKGETDSFFRRFYGYNLSDEEYEAFGKGGHDE